MLYFHQAFNYFLIHLGSVRDVVVVGLLRCHAKYPGESPMEANSSNVCKADSASLPPRLINEHLLILGLNSTFSDRLLPLNAKQVQRDWMLLV